MALKENDQNEIRQYLLGQLSDEQQQAMERRFVVEDDIFEELEASETQLIDEYAAGELDEAARRQVEQHFMTRPGRERDLAFARIFRRYVNSRTDSRSGSKADSQSAAKPANFYIDHPNQRTAQAWCENSGWLLRAAATVAVVALIAAIAWFALPRTSTPRTLATLNLTLSAGNRAEGVSASKVALPSEGLKLVLRLPDGSTPTTGYRARLLSGDGEVKTLEIVDRDAQTVSAVIPAGLLKPGPYAVKLLTLAADGSEQPINGSYFFTVE